MSPKPERVTWIAGGVAFLVSFGMYTWTAAPDLGLVDSAELALAAATGGIAHPPGFPLFLLVGRVFAALPFADPVRMLNLMSAFFVAAAVGTVLVGTERMLALRRDAREDGARRMGAAAVAAAAFATAWNPWEWSSVTEVYALNVFLLCASWLCAWCGALALAERKGGAIPAGAWPWLTAAAIFASLGLANHHLTAALAFPLLLVMLAWVRPRVLATRRFWITSVACVLGSLSLYLYLFVAAANDGGLGWGRVDSLTLLLRHVIGSQYSQQVGSSPAEAMKAGRSFVQMLVLGVGVLPTALVFLGIFLGARRAGDKKRKLDHAGLLTWIAPAQLVLTNLVLSMGYIAGPEDRMAYDLPATVAWCMLAGLGAWFILGFGGVAAGVAKAGAAAAAAVRGRTRAIATLLGVLTIGINFWHHYDACNHRDEYTARLFVEESLRGVPPNSVLFTTEWNLYAPYLWMRQMEGFRTDLNVVDLLMMRRFWYMGYLEHEMPTLVAASTEQFAIFAEQIRRFDLGEPFDDANMQDYYNRLMWRWVEIGDGAGGAFVDPSCFEKPQEMAWLSRVPTRPDGLLIRMIPDGAPMEDMVLEPFDADNQRYIRARLTDLATTGDFSDLTERHHPYYRVYRTYRTSVLASLVFAAKQNEPSFAFRKEQYRAWFPDIEDVSITAATFR